MSGRVSLLVDRPVQAITWCVACVVFLTLARPVQGVDASVHGLDERFWLMESASPWTQPIGGVSMESEGFQSAN